MPTPPKRTPLYGRHHKGSPKVFLVIYLLVAIAITVAVLFLKKGKPSIDEMLASEQAKQAAQKKEMAAPPKPAPKEKPKSKEKGKEPDKLANAGKSSGKKKPEPEPEPDPEPEPEPEPEPQKPTLTAEEEKEIEALFPFKEIPTLLEYVDNWNDVPQRAFPKLVAIKKPVDFEMVQGGQVVARGKMPVGSKMVPVRLQGDQLVLSGGGANPISVTVPVEETDFKELIETRYNVFVESQNAQVLAQRTAERNRRLGAILHEENLTDWNDGSDPRFDPIKASLQKGEVGIYSLSDASKWRWGGPENIDGTEFETAYVLIISEAAFGVTEVELKVLMQEGKVVLWLDPATGERI